MMKFHTRGLGSEFWVQGLKVRVKSEPLIRDL